MSVLWVTAALSVLLIAMNNVTRTEARSQIQLHERARITALLDGALRYAAAVIMVANERPLIPATIHLPLQGHLLEVSIVADSGLVNVNHANDELLTDLFVSAAGLSFDQAKVLAQRIIEWRSPAGAATSGGLRQEETGVQPRHAYFVKPEDLRQVQGLNPGIYYKIQPLISVSRIGTPAVNPLAAPEEVLLLLADGARDLVDGLMSARAQDQFDAQSFDTSRFKHSTDRRSTIYRLTAAHLDAEGRKWHRVAWVEVPPGKVNAPASAWRHVEPITIVMGANE